MTQKRTSVNVAREASIINGGMAVAQIGATLLTGNVGFIGEAAHNAGDAISFEAKARAMENGDKDRVKSLRLRFGAASIFAAGGAAGLSAGTYELLTKHAENASTTALGVAIACAGLNTIVAKRAHRSVKLEDGSLHSACDHAHEHQEQSPHVEKSQKVEAMIDTKLHAVSDAGTGWIYTAGLAAQAKGYGEHWAELAIISNGVISSLVASASLRRIARDKNNK